MTAAISTQPHQRITQAAKAFGALTQCAALVVGIPYALTQFVGNPFPVKWPSVSEARLAIELRDFSEDRKSVV